MTHEERAVVEWLRGRAEVFKAASKAARGTGSKLYFKAQSEALIFAYVLIERGEHRANDLPAGS